MRDEILARAEFLLTELRLTPVDAQLRLKDWFPDLEHEERVRYIGEASQLGMLEGRGELRESEGDLPAVPPESELQVLSEPG